MKHERRERVRQTNVEISKYNNRLLDYHCCYLLSSIYSRGMKTMSKKQIVRVVVWSKLLDEIFHVLLEEHPDIIARCIVQVVTKNPELFKKGKDET